MYRSLLILLAGAALTVASPLRAQDDGALNTPRAAGEFNGRWALVQATTTVSRVVGVGRVRTTTTAVMYYDLEDDGALISGEGALCDVHLHTGSPFIRTVLPSALVSVLEAPRLRASVDSYGEFVQPRSYALLGVELEDRAGESLPTDPDDPRIVDCDGDGHPGGTVQISGIVSGEVYFAQRSWSELEGHRTTPNAFEGRVRFDEEQVILGASRRALRSGPPTEPADDPDQNWFHLVRLADGAGCAEALGYAESVTD